MKIDFQNISKIIHEQPEEIKNIIFSEKFYGIILQISKDSNLDDEKTFSLNDLICYVLLGLIPKKDFKDNLNEITTNTDAQEKINLKVEELIFLPIASILNSRKIIPNITTDTKLKIKELLKNKNWFEEFQQKDKSNENSINKSINEYISSTPKSLVEKIKDKTWKKRVEEVAIKYSLNEEQTIILQNLVLFTIIDVENGETLEDSIEKELGISKLLAEQIVKDIDTRVFQYLSNLITEEIKEINPVPPEKVEEKNTVAENNLPEIKPEMSPMVEKGEGVKINPISTNNTVNLVKSTAPDNLPGMEIEKDEETKTFIGSDFIQKPVAPIKTPEPMQEPVVQKVEVPKPQSEVQYPPKYSSDPYREPIE